MTRASRWSLLLCFFGSVMATFALAKSSPEKSYFQVDIHRIGPQKLAAIKAHQGLSWWIEADDQLLVLANDDFSLADRSVRRLAIEPRPDHLFFVQKGHHRDLEDLNADILAKAGRMALLQARDSLPVQGEKGDMRILKFEPNAVFVKQESNSRSVPGLPANPTIESMIAALNGDRWQQDVGTLATMNRYSYGEGVKTARDWLIARFKENTGITVESPEYKRSSLQGWNVVATIEGTERPDELYIFGAHYDSTSEDPDEAAPGAEDNASGTAGLLELARIFSVHRPKATVIFVAFSGEEQGLWGSEAYVRSLISSGKKDKVKAVVTMDMIGYDRNNTLDCLIEASKKDKDFVAALRNAAATYTRLEFKTSEHYWGSDHVSFIDEGIPAVLAIEDDWDDYPDYHRTTDRPENVKTEMGLEVLKMNLATIANWAN